MPNVIKKTEDGDCMWWCPGCKCHHGLRDRGQRTLGAAGPKGPTWSWNGDLANPTITPSVRHSVFRRGQRVTTCHYHIVDGRIRYARDCRHGLAGKTTAMTPIDQV